MTTLIRICALALLLAAAPACTAHHDGRPEIVATTNILGDLTRAIVGDTAEVTVLMPPNADPHQFALSAQAAARIERSDLLVHNGLGLEEGIRRHIESAADAGVDTLSVGDHVDPIRYRAADETRPDPHFWTDPTRARRAAHAIADRVAAIDGIDANTVRANASRYGAELDHLDAALAEQFARIPADRRKLVTNHHVFGYLAQRYGFQVIGTVLPSGTTLASPSASDLAGLADTVRAARVPAVFADASQPDRLARVLADQAGVHVRIIPLHSESLTDPAGGAPTYLDMMRANAEAIVSGLTTP